MNRKQPHRTPTMMSELTSDPERPMIGRNKRKIAYAKYSVIKKGKATEVKCRARNWTGLPVKKKRHKSLKIFYFNFYMGFFVSIVNKIQLHITQWIIYFNIIMRKFGTSLWIDNHLKAHYQKICDSMFTPDLYIMQNLYIQKVNIHLQISFF